MIFEAVLEALSAEQRDAGEFVRPPASAEAVALAERMVCADLQAMLPADYAQFLRSHDGIDYNGVVFYGASASPGRPSDGGFWQSIVAANTLWRAAGGNAGLLVLGDSDMDIYAVPAAGGAPGKYDRVSGDRLEDYADVATMIEAVLKQRR